MKPWRNLAALTLSGLLVSGCHLPSASKSQRQTLSASVAADFAYAIPRGVYWMQETGGTTNQGYSVHKIELRGLAPSMVSNGASRTLVLDYFLPAKNEKHPVILILPMLGGSYPLEKYFAAYFAK